MPKENTKSERRVDSATLPKSLEAERTILGAIVLNNEALLKILPSLRAEEFFLTQHRRIYSCMEELIAGGAPIDPVTMMDALNRRGELEAVGGAAYLSQLSDGLPRASNVEHYARIVREKAQLRALIYACHELTEKAQIESDPGELVERAVETFLALTGGSDNVAKIIEWKDAAEKAVRELEVAHKNPKSVSRINSGIEKLDEMTAGLRKKEITLIVGGTGHGKSLLAEEFAVTAEGDGYSGMIFSAEMSAESVALRQLAYESDTYFYHVRRPETLEDRNIENLKFAAKRERNLPIVDSGITPARIWALGEARKRSTGLDFMVVDYDQLVVQAGMGENADEESFFGKQAEFIFRAKKFAERLDIAFILLAQLRKIPSGVKAGGKPSIDDIYGHSAMRNTPHVIMFVVRDFLIKNYDKKYKNAATAYVLKSRNDQTGAVPLFFDDKRLRFLDKKKGDDPFEDS